MVMATLQEVIDCPRRFRSLYSDRDCYFWQGVRTPGVSGDVFNAENGNRFSLNRAISCSRRAGRATGFRGATPLPECPADADFTG